MTGDARGSQFVSGGRGVEIETYVHGDGPPFVILPCEGRDGGYDYDHLTARIAGAGWKVLRPQPRGTAGSRGPMHGLTLDDLASDVATCIRALGPGPAVVLGHGFGNVLARVLADGHADLVAAVVLAAMEAPEVPEAVGPAPFVAGDPSAPEAERLAALRKAFFAANHDARIWLTGWYPETLKMQREALGAAAQHCRECGAVPLLQIIAEHDPFLPIPHWNEMRRRFGERVTVTVIKEASHALFPEQPDAVAEAVLSWAAHHRPSVGKDAGSAVRG